MGTLTELVIHLGYPKTGTSTFQTHVFPHHDEIEYLGKFIPGHRYRDERMFGQIDELIRRGESFEPDLTWVSQHVSQVRTTTDRKVVLFSSEAFLHPMATDPRTIARRIQRTFSPCSVVLTIREQLSALRSFHTMHGKFGQYLYIDALGDEERLRFPLSFEDWLYIQFRAPDRNLIGTLRYYETVAELVTLLGRDRVRVLIYEDLVTRPDKYLETLSSVLRVDERTTKRLFGEHRENVSTKASFWRELSRSKRVFADHTDYAARVREYYRFGNSKLQTLLTIPLAELGYCS